MPEKKNWSNRGRVKMRKLVSTILGCFALSYGSVFFVDPQNGSINNDGSSQNPWSTLQEVIDNNKIETRQPAAYPYHWGEALEPKNAGAPVKAGDTLLLRTGFHGEITISRCYNTDFITIAAQEGHTPGALSLKITGACKWRVKGLEISPEFVSPYAKVSPLAVVENHNYSGPSREIFVEDCFIYSLKDASSWTMSDWDTKSCNAIGVSGTHVTIRNNHCKNVNFGISVSGDSCLIDRNTVENFAGDGLRGLGDDETFSNNLIKNCYDVNSNHDDGFQSWSRTADGVGKGTVYRIKLIGNTIINYENPDQPFRGTLQGIGCFDGFFEDWVIKNNVIITDHWHGITLLGAFNCRIVNNTVCDLNNQNPGPPWIRIGDHKTRGSSSGCIVRNNLTTSLNSSDIGVTEDHNIIISDPTDFFVDYDALDLRLKAECDAIDAGNESLAPSTDITGTLRPQGSGIDIGAYEYTDTAVDPTKAAGIGGHNIAFHISTCSRHMVVYLSGMRNINLTQLSLVDFQGQKVMEFVCRNRYEWHGKKAYNPGPGIYALTGVMDRTIFYRKLVVTE
ncbi:MAG: hypothetical protein GF401_14910 [Chitinivibrionales bacterium]|nr:hypothetical protein [Chitinivibrionales bacterium]